MKPTVLLLTLTTLLSITACIEQDAPPVTEAVKTSQQSIINGNLDNSRQAVIAIASEQSLCSGTIVKTEPARGLGWVLTAAHCVDDNPQAILQGNDYTNATRQYPVVDYVAHPAYSTRDTTFDFAVILFSGADNSTPVIPIVGNSDNLSTGDFVTSVGYGRTTPSNQAPDNNSRRRNVNRNIDRNTNSELLVYDISDAGICQGDSGGPVLTDNSGQERVAGVHSSVSDECQGYGFSGRVTSARGWIQGQLDGEVEETCDLCRQVALSGNGDCTSVSDACFNDERCGGFAQCLNNCTTEACQTQCTQTYSDAVDDYLAIFTCVCEDACTNACSGDAFCPEPTECGIAFQDQTCNTCQENSCCNEALRCDNDPDCRSCLSGEAGDCGAGTAFDDYYQCLEGSCADACGIEVAECGFTADGACGTCLEGSCCDETADCADDDACSVCLSGQSDDCDNNQLLDDVINCFASCDGDPCGVGSPNPNNNNPNNNTGNNSNNITGNNGNNTGNNGNNTGNNSGPNNNTGNNSTGNNNTGDNNAGNNNNNGRDGFVDGGSGGGGEGAQGCAASTVPSRPVSGGALALMLGLLALVGLRKRD